MKYKPTEKFASLDHGSSYQGLNTDVYISLKHGEEVEIKKPPEHLISGGYIKPAHGVIKQPARPPVEKEK